MEPDQKRIYRSGRYGVAIGTSVPPKVFDDIEGLATQFELTKSEVIRRLISLGIAECKRGGRLPPLIWASSNTNGSSVNPPDVKS